MNLRTIVSTMASFAMLIILGACSSNGTSASNTCTTASTNAKKNAWVRLLTVNDFGGSTFTACKTGVITSITVDVDKESTAQPKSLLFLESGMGNGVEGYQSYADYHQAISLKGEGKSTTITLKTPFPVKKGEMYTWYVQKDPDAGPLVQAAAEAPNNKYAEGKSWYNNDTYSSMDNVFSVKIK